MFVLKNQSFLLDKLKENLPFKINTDFGIYEILNQKILLNEFGDKIIKVQMSSEDFKFMKKLDPPCKNISIREYVINYLNSYQNLYYFKCEDSYDFLSEINKKQHIINKYKFGKNGRVSFWWGNKNTITPFHYDSYGFKQDRLIKLNYGEEYYKKPFEHSILTVVEGKKKIYIIHPKYSKFLKHNTELQNGASWCLESTECILNNKNIKYETVILNAGESINLPMFWWHKIENLERGLAITYSFSI